MWCYFQPCFHTPHSPFAAFSIPLGCSPSHFFPSIFSIYNSSALFSSPHILYPPNTPCRDKFVEVDLKPVCKHCYERLPDDMKRRLARRDRDSKDKKKKPLIPMCLWSSFSPFSSTAMFPLLVSSLLAFLSILFVAFYIRWICTINYLTSASLPESAGRIKTVWSLQGEAFISSDSVAVAQVIEGRTHGSVSLLLLVRWTASV